MSSPFQVQAQESGQRREIDCDKQAVPTTLHLVTVLLKPISMTLSSIDDHPEHLHYYPTTGLASQGPVSFK
jgi:hypothetical protein